MSKYLEPQCDSDQRIEDGPDFTGEFVIPGRTPEAIWVAHYERYRFAAQMAANKKILDVACGTGYGSDHLARQGAVSVVGGDISGEAVAYAKRHFKQQNLSFVKLSADRLPFPPSTFDVVVSFETLEHVGNSDAFLDQCCRVLRPGGVFLCSTPMRLAWRPPWVPNPNNPFHTREYSLSELRVAVGDRFDHVEFFGQTHIRFPEVFTNYVAFSSALLLSFISRGESLSHKAVNGIQSLLPSGLRSGSLNRDLFVVRPLRRTFPGLPGALVVKAVRRAEIPERRHRGVIE